VSQESAHAALAWDHPESISERRVSLLRSLLWSRTRENYPRLATVKQYLGASLTLPMTYYYFFLSQLSDKLLGVLLVPPYVHRFLIYLGMTFTEFFVLVFSVGKKNCLSSLGYNAQFVRYSQLSFYFNKFQISMREKSPLDVTTLPNRKITNELKN